MKSRVGTLVSMLVVAVAAFALYMVKYRVQALQTEIAEVSRQIDEEREAYNVASAEWAYLTQPERLQRLSEKYLRMQPVKSAQVTSLDGLEQFAEQRSRGGKIVMQASARRNPSEAE